MDRITGFGPVDGGSTPPGFVWKREKHVRFAVVLE